MYVSEFIKKVFEKEIKTIITGSECEFVGCCSYFLQRLTGENLVLDVEINPLVATDYINRMVALGVHIDGVTDTTYRKKNFFASPGRVEKFAIRRSPVDWIFSINDSTLINCDVSDNGNSGYIPLIAYFIVSKFVENHRVEGKLILATQLSNGEPYYNTLILMKYGNKLIENYVEIENCSLGQAEWFAYIAMQRQYCRMFTEHDSIEKYKWLESNKVKPGDVVLLYTVGTGKEIASRQLLSCYPAVVKSFDRMSITLEIVHSTELVLTQVERVSQTNFADRETSDYDNLYKTTERYSFTSVGFEYLTLNEDYMIMLPMRDDMSSQMMILPSENSDSWELRHIEMDTIETIYAVFENRGIEYNRERFIELYFKNSVPFYERYRKHQPTKFENISNAELIQKYGEGVA